MNIWFTADLHLNSYETIDYFNRPFKSLEHMNRILINNWNARVKPNDEVYHIGDFCIKNKENPHKAIYWEDKLNGKIIHILGNHDRNNGVKAITTDAHIYYGNKKIQLVHNPEHLGIMDGCRLAFTAHVHLAWKIKKIRRMFDYVDCINVGTDVWNYRPVSYNEIMNRYTQWLKKEI